MEKLGSILPIIIYILLIGLIVLGIIIGIKIIITMNKVEKVVDNVEQKVNSLNGLFNVIEVTSDKISGVYTKLFDIVRGCFEKVFLKGKEREEEYEQED